LTSLFIYVIIVLHLTKEVVKLNRFCESCKKRKTCTEICQRVQCLLDGVTNNKSINEELPYEFKYQFYSNQNDWPTPPKEYLKKQRERNRKTILYFRFKKSFTIQEISDKLKLSTIYVKRVLKRERERK